MTQVIPDRTGPGDGCDSAAVGLHETQPGDAKAAMLDGDIAGFAIKIVPISHPHDERIDAAQHRVHAAQAPDPLLGLLRGGDVLHRVEPALAPLRIGRPGNRLHDLAQVDPGAIGPPDAVFDLGTPSLRADAERRAAKELPVGRVDQIEPASRARGDVFIFDAEKVGQRFRPRLERAVGLGDHMGEPRHELSATKAVGLLLELAERYRSRRRGIRLSDAGRRAFVLATRIVLRHAG